MTLTQIAYFVKTAETGSLTGAAREFMIAQPSLSQSIRKLEEELGFALFEKTGRRLALTREGGEFLGYAKKLLEARDAAELAAHNIFEENQGRIRLAHTEPTPADFMPGLISGFLGLPENSGVRIESDVAGSAKIIRDLRADEIDLGLCSRPLDAAEDILLYPLFRRPMVLIAAEGDPLCKLPEVRPEDLISRPCISYGTGSAMQLQISGFWRELGLEPTVRYRSSAVAIEGLVARGLGWAFVARTDAALAPGVRELNMPKLQLQRTMYLAVRAGRKHGPAAERFQKFVLDYSGSFR